MYHTIWIYMIYLTLPGTTKQMRKILNWYVEHNVYRYKQRVLVKHVPSFLWSRRFIWWSVEDFSAINKIWVSLSMTYGWFQQTSRRHQDAVCASNPAVSCRPFELGTQTQGMQWMAKGHWNLWVPPSHDSGQNAALHSPAVSTIINHGIFALNYFPWFPKKISIDYSYYTCKYPKP